MTFMVRINNPMPCLGLKKNGLTMNMTFIKNNRASGRTAGGPVTCSSSWFFVSFSEPRERVVDKKSYI